MAQAVKWHYRVKNGLTTKTAGRRISNTEILSMVEAYPELWRCAEIVCGYPKNQRVVPTAMATALLDLFGRVDWTQAETFVEGLCTGENLESDDTVMVLRGAFIRDMQQHAKLPSVTKVWMIVKAWNSLRRGRPIKNASSFRPRQDETFPGVMK